MKISLGDAIRDLGSTPEKGTTFLLLCVCMLIPIVGPIVLSGYLIRRFASVRKGLPATDFKFDFFGEYLQIGLWPFLVSLVVSLILTPIYLACYLPMVFIAMDPESEGLVIVSILLVVLLFFLVTVMVTLVLYPVMLRSGLMMNFGAGFSVGFVLDFIKRVGGQIILWVLILGLIAIPLYLVGYMLLFIGVFPVAAAISFAGYHIMFQLYDLYRERGGEEIPVADYVYSSVPTGTSGAPPPPLPPGGSE